MSDDELEMEMEAEAMRLREAEAPKPAAPARALTMWSTLEAANQPADPRGGRRFGLPIPRDESGKITTPLAELMKLTKKNIKFGDLYRYRNLEGGHKP